MEKISNIKNTKTISIVWEPKVKLGETLETINPFRKLSNIIVNAAKLPNGSFRRSGTGIEVVLKDVVGQDLIVTTWQVPRDYFNRMVTSLVVTKTIREEEAYVN